VFGQVEEKVVFLRITDKKCPGKKIVRKKHKKAKKERIILRFKAFILILRGLYPFFAFIKQKAGFARTFERWHSVEI